MSDKSIRWFFVSLLYRFSPKGERQVKSSTRCLANENWHLINAETAIAARRKALRIARNLCSTPMFDENTKKEGNFVLVGINAFWPIIDDDFYDGAEIAWFKHDNIRFERLRSMISKTRNGVRGLDIKRKRKGLTM